MTMARTGDMCTRCVNVDRGINCCGNSSPHMLLIHKQYIFSDYIFSCTVTNIQFAVLCYVMMSGHQEIYCTALSVWLAMGFSVQTVHVNFRPHSSVKNYNSGKKKVFFLVVLHSMSIYVNSPTIQLVINLSLQHCDWIMLSFPVLHHLSPLECM